MASYNELFHSAENPDSPDSAKIKNRIPAGNLIRIVDSLQTNAIKVAKASETAQNIDDVAEHFSRLGRREKILLSAYLLKAAELYHILKEYEAMSRALQAIDLLEREGVPVNRYDMQSN